MHSKEATFQQYAERRRDKETTSLRLGEPKVPSKERNAKPVFPLFQGLGSHCCTAHAGTPPQVTTLLVDAGSEMTGFPCAGCEDCSDDHADPCFCLERSTSFEKVTDCKECLD